MTSPTPRPMTDLALALYGLVDWAHDQLDDEQQDRQTLLEQVLDQLEKLAEQADQGGDIR